MAAAGKWALPAPPSAGSVVAAGREYLAVAAPPGERPVGRPKDGSAADPDTVDRNKEPAAKREPGPSGQANRMVVVTEGHRSAAAESTVPWMDGKAAEADSDESAAAESRALPEPPTDEPPTDEALPVSFALQKVEVFRAVMALAALVSQTGLLVRSNPDLAVSAVPSAARDGLRDRIVLAEGVRADGAKAAFHEALSPSAARTQWAAAARQASWERLLGELAALQAPAAALGARLVLAAARQPGPGPGPVLGKKGSPSASQTMPGLAAE